MTWFVAGASLFATWLDPRRIRACFAIWFLTCVTWAVLDFTHRLPAQVRLMVVRAGRAVRGWVAWGRSATNA